MLYQTIHISAEFIYGIEHFMMYWSSNRDAIISIILWSSRFFSALLFETDEFNLVVTSLSFRFLFFFCAMISLVGYSLFNSTLNSNKSHCFANCVFHIIGTLWYGNYVLSWRLEDSLVLVSDFGDMSLYSYIRLHLLSELLLIHFILFVSVCLWRIPFCFGNFLRLTYCMFVCISLFEFGRHDCLWSYWKVSVGLVFIFDIQSLSFFFESQTVVNYQQVKMYHFLFRADQRKFKCLVYHLWFHSIKAECRV